MDRGAARLRAWRDTDVEAVLRINAASQPHVARLDRAEIRRLLAMAARFWIIAGSDDSPIAYLIAFSGDAPYDGEEFACFSRRLDGGFLYIDQVAIHPQYRRYGLGRALYDHVTRLARAEQLRALCCEVNLVPPNPDSRLFHARAGFVTLGELELADGRTVELLTRKLNGVAV
jgi:predicted GNAT superfamily acetyltransferase